MKGLGAILVMLSSFLLRSFLLRRQRERLLLGEELCRALDQLRRGTCHLRCPLPQLLQQCRRESVVSSFFFDALLEGIDGEKETVLLWQRCSALLPPPYDALLRPLGTVLRQGDQEDVLILTREEIHRFVQEGRRQLGEQDKLVTTLCLSFALLLVVVLI